MHFNRLFRKHIKMLFVKSLHYANDHIITSLVDSTICFPMLVNESNIDSPVPFEWGSYDKPSFRNYTIIKVQAFKMSKKTAPIHIGRGSFHAYAMLSSSCKMTPFFRWTVVRKMSISSSESVSHRSSGTISNEIIHVSFDLMSLIISMDCFVMNTSSALVFFTRPISI